MAIKIEDIVFWIVILIAIGIIIWKLFSSPTDIATLISIASLLFISELTLWKAIFNTEKKAEIGFIKVKRDLSILKTDINHIKENLASINNKLDNIKISIKK